MSDGQLSMLDEYSAIFEELGDHGAAFWKFFDMFRVNLGDSEADGTMKGIYYGKDASWRFATDDQLKQLKNYWKEQRRWIKKEGKGAAASECRRRMWFWAGKMKEWNVFDLRIRRDILYWMDFAMERTMEGSMVRVEYLNGQPVVAKVPQ